MTGFNSKVALLEKWHNIIRPEADLLAELIVDTWHEATECSEQRIIKLLEDKLPKTLRLVYEVCVDETGLYDPNEAVFVKDALIALIKGEK